MEWKNGLVLQTKVIVLQKDQVMHLITPCFTLLIHTDLDRSILHTREQHVVA